MGSGWKDLGLRPHLRGNLAWYALALLACPVVTGLILLTGRVLGLVQLPSLSSAALVLMLQAFALGFALDFGKNLFEEGAWRGYLAPKAYAPGLPRFG